MRAGLAAVRDAKHNRTTQHDIHLHRRVRAQRGAHCCARAARSSASPPLAGRRSRGPAAAAAAPCSRCPPSPPRLNSVMNSVCGRALPRRTGDSERLRERSRRLRRARPPVGASRARVRAACRIWDVHVCGKVHMHGWQSMQDWV